MEDNYYVASLHVSRCTDFQLYLVFDPSPWSYRLVLCYLWRSLFCHLLPPKLVHLGPEGEKIDRHFPHFHPVDFWVKPICQSSGAVPFTTLFAILVLWCEAKIMKAMVSARVVMEAGVVCDTKVWSFSSIGVLRSLHRRV